MRESNPRLSVLYFFFKHLQPDKRTFAAMLLSLLSQVMLQDEVVLDIVYQRFVSADQQKIRSVSLLRELAALALKAQSYCFVVVDGLDECVDSFAKSEDAQGEVIDWLETLMATPDPSSTQPGSSKPDDRCLRLLISGQRNGYLEKRLEQWPAIQIDSSSAHMNDIQAYSAAKGIEIQKRFGTDEATRLDIISKVNRRALGEFQKYLAFLYTEADGEQACSSTLKSSWITFCVSRPAATSRENSRKRISQRAWTKRTPPKAFPLCI
jgi:hypothetical protein